MNRMTLTILDVVTVAGRTGVAAAVAVTPPTSLIPSTLTFRARSGGRWRVSEIGNVDPPPASGRLMVGLSPVGDQSPLEVGAVLEAEGSDVG